jgi:quercetin dioxygenase-like cupin family protein
LKITNLKTTAKTKVTMQGADKVMKQIPIGAKEGAPNFVFRVFTMEPGGYTPYHSHPFEHVNYIIEGEGVIVDVDGKEHDVKQGDFALVMPDEKHQYKNASKDKPFTMICAVIKQYE